MKVSLRLLVVSTVIGLSLTAALAQQETRVRRTEAKPSEARTDAPAMDANGNVTPTPAAKADEDPIAALRAQIEAASLIQDRNRLQLKLADELLKTGHKTEALKELFLVLNANGFDPVGFYNLGNAFARLGETQSAVTAYQRAIEQRNGRYSRAQNNLGVVFLREGRWDEAHAAFSGALKTENFRYAEADYNLGRLYAARGQSDLAVRAWRRALHVDPNHMAAKQALARGEDEPEITIEKPSVKSVSPTTSKAAPAPRPAGRLSLDQISFDYLQRAREAAERGKSLEAIDNFRRVISRQSGYFAPANLELSYALLAVKRNDEALAQLVQVSQRDGARYPVSYFHLARLYELQGNLKQAETAFEQAVNAYGANNAQPLLDLSRVREKQGNYKGALEAMERYVTLMHPAWGDERIAELRAKAH